MKKRSTKYNLKKLLCPVIILIRKATGRAMQLLKKIWQDWQWAIALVALLYGIFLFYYQSTTSTPTRIKNCEERIAAHIVESDARFKKIEEDYGDVKLSSTRLEAMMNISLQDLGILKSYITGEAHHK